MGYLKGWPTGLHQSERDEILSCSLYLHIHLEAVTTYSMSEENVLRWEIPCIGREYVCRSVSSSCQRVAYTENRHDDKK